MSVVAELGFTEQQARAIEARDGSLLLVANAGSGKTSVLVERLVRTVVEDGVPLAEVLAITFTEKAAAQLSERVRARLVELGEPEIARAAEDAQISTIHALCAAILRANALRAGLDPRFTVLTGDDAARLAADAFRAAVEDVVDHRGERAMDLLATYTPDVLRTLVVDVHDERRSRGHHAGELPPLHFVPDPRGARDALARAVASLRAELATVDAPANGIAKALAALDRCDTLLGAPPEEIHQRGEILANKLTAATVRSLGPAGEAYADALTAYAQACFDHRNVGLYEELRELVRAFARQYAEAKRTRSSVDFTDLELGTDRLLDDERLRERWAGRYRTVMVDEFQDTNPLQLRIIDRLAPDALFAVGDEFQSIYRFRHAAVELFRERRARLAEVDRAWPLAINFRSEPELLDALDLAWAPLFGERFVPLESPPDKPRGSVDPPVELLITGKEGWTEVDLGEIQASSTAWRLAEARLLAQRMRELGRRPGDMVVLVRATTDMAVYERALEAAGLPTYVVGGRGYWSQRQVQDVVAYLSVLANPRDDIRVLELLTSPMAGVSSDTLWLLAQAGRELGEGPWRAMERVEEIPGLDPGDRAKIRTLYGHLAEDRTAAARAPLAALIERAVSATGFDLAMLAMPGGERRLANVRKLQRLAREHEAANGRDLRGFLDRVTALTEEELGPDRESEAPVEGDGLDAVRIMTIHRAKGLEFPVVAVADLGREPRSLSHDLVRLADDGRVGLKVPTLDDGRVPAFAYEAIGDAEARAEVAEERRLLYVAMTRAGEHLILSGALRLESNGAREPLAWIAGAFVPDWRERLTAEAPTAVVEREEGPWSARIAAALSAPWTVGTVLRDTAPERQAAEPEIVIRRAAAPARVPARPADEASVLGLEELSYSALEAYRRCPYRFYLQRVVGLPDDAAPGEGPPASGPSATERGTRIHAALERLDLADPRPPDDADPHVARLVANFAGSRLRERLAAASDVRREAKFSFALGDGLRLGGALDVLAREGAEALVVDYKSDRVGDEDLAARTERDYATQRLVYALAVLSNGFPSVDVVHCYLERPDEPVAARYTAADAPALREQLVALAAGLRAGAIEPTAEPHRALCATCPARAGLCRHPEELTLREAPPREPPGEPGAAAQQSLF